MNSKQNTLENTSTESNWEKIELGDVLSFRNGKSSAKHKGVKNGKYPVYGANGPIARTNDFLEEEPVIIVGRVGAYCGNVQRTEGKCWSTDNTIIVRAENSELSFVYYLLSNLNLQQYRTGTSQPLLTQTSLKDIKVEFPPKSEQEKIGEILNNLDQKIMINNNVKNILEEMAQLSSNLGLLNLSHMMNSKVQKLDPFLLISLLVL